MTPISRHNRMGSSQISHRRAIMQSGNQNMDSSLGSRNTASNHLDSLSMVNSRLASTSRRSTARTPLANNMSSINTASNSMANNMGNRSTASYHLANNMGSLSTVMQGYRQKQRT